MKPVSLNRLCTIGLGMCILVGCNQNDPTVRNNDKSDWAGVFKSQSRNRLSGSDSGSSGGLTNASSAAPSSSSGNWSIIVDVVQGIGHQSLADHAVQDLNGRIGGTGFWSRKSTNESTICYGRYESRDSNAAKSDLNKLKQWGATGKIRPRPFMLVPISENRIPTAAGSASDLQSVRDRADVTLQIGYYDRQFRDDEFGGDFRKAAEAAANQLRNDHNIDVYFYHGPNRSLITVGLFNNSVLTPVTKEEQQQARALEALRKQFPYNLWNGMTLRIARRGMIGTNPLKNEYTPSFLVRLPQ